MHLIFSNKRLLLRRISLDYVDHKGNTLQIMMEEDKSYWVELPCPDEEGSYGKRTSMEDISSLLGSLPLLFEKEKFPGFEFNSWQG